MSKQGRFNLPALVALVIIVVAFVACGDEATTPADDAPTGGETQAGATPSPTGTTPSGDRPAEGGTTTAQDRPPASAAEYSVICEIASRPAGDLIEDPYDLDAAAAIFKDYLEEWESVEPPEELAGWHAANAAYLRDVQELLADGPGEGASEAELDEYLETNVFPVVLRHGQEIGGVVRDMKRGVIAAMFEAGCLDEGALDVIFTAAEIRELRLEEDDKHFLVSAGGVHTCAVRVDGLLECWGDDAHGRSTPPGGRFDSVSAGGAHACGVRLDGTVECWGSNVDWQGNVTGQAEPPAGEFTSVSAGGDHTCGVRLDGTVECWGSNDRGQSAPPGGAFASVSAGAGYACGVRSGGSVECWGESRGPAEWLEDFTSVSAGYGHLCGLDGDGWVVCVDDADAEQPPDGEFVSVSAGGYHTCGLRPDGSVECWGSNDAMGGEFAGQATPPGGAFAAVSAGEYHTCGLRPDGTVECWGDDSGGKATPPEEWPLSWQRP